MASPFVAIVIKSIWFVLLGANPAIKHPRVEFDTAATAALATVRLPKSTAFAVVGISTKSIRSVTDGCGDLPPAHTPLVDDPHARTSFLESDKLPKSIAVSYTHLRAHET